MDADTERWSMMFLRNLLDFEYEQSRSPAGAIQWVTKGGALANSVADAHVKGRMTTPIMLTTDLSLKEDPAYRKISERFLANPEEFEDAFARAWFKLTHRDMGPSARYLGSAVPTETLLWQDPIPKADHGMIDASDAGKLKKMILDSGLTVPELVRTAWASAASYRNTDMRGGANGARVRLEPQKSWAVNDPQELSKTLEKLEKIRKEFNDGKRGKSGVSLADVIVLGGAAAIEKAAMDAGYNVTVPFAPGRTDALQEMTDVESFAMLELHADAFRNFHADGYALEPAVAMVDRADLLTLTVPELTVLIGGLRVLDANTGGARHGVFTDEPGTLTNDFFVNLLDMSTAWSKSETEGVYEGHDRASGKPKWTATSVDLLFGSHPELRAVAEVYASRDGDAKFVDDFVAAWSKVMQLDRFDLK